jgi:hypothetical protein
MKSAFALVALISLAQSACAQPNYQDVKSLKQESKPASATCPLFFSTENLCATLDWVKKPTEEVTGSFTLKFYSPAIVMADPKLDLKVVIWMPDMGHGSSPVTITRKSIGSYDVDGVFFSMHGGWQIRVQLKNAQAVAEEQIANVTF